MKDRNIDKKVKEKPDFKFKKIFLVFLFFSGFCALTYEIVWLRKLRLILGSDSAVISLILTYFMAGMGAGNLIFGYLSDRKSPLKIYRYLEFQ